MMTNLFSVFDPSTSNSISLNWLSLLIPIILTPQIFWITNSRLILIYKNFFNFIFSEVKTLMGQSLTKLTPIMFITIMWFIFITNLLGLFPYIFTSSSHMVISISLSFPLWLTFMIFGWTNNTNNMFSHLLPQGTPPALMIFMIIIETISNLIRPLTLAIRLSANMIAGHLLLALLGGQGSSQSMTISFMVIFSQLFLMTLELAVAMIQAYVFMVLLTLYSTEIH